MKTLLLGMIASLALLFSAQAQDEVIGEYTSEYSAETVSITPTDTHHEIIITWWEDGDIFTFVGVLYATANPGNFLIEGSYYTGWDDLFLGTAYGDLLFANGVSHPDSVIWDINAYSTGNSIRSGWSERN